MRRMPRPRVRRERRRPTSDTGISRAVDFEPEGKSAYGVGTLDAFNGSVVRVSRGTPILSVGYSAKKARSALTHRLRTCNACPDSGEGPE